MKRWEDMSNIEWIRQRIKKNEYEYFDHADYEREQDRLSVEDIEQVLLAGHIIEDYPRDPRGPSCLVLGYTSLPIHIVCNRASENVLRILTAYIPAPPKWVTPSTRGGDKVMQTYADCSFCGGRVVEKRVQKACWWGGRIKALINNVPAGVCTQCGERFYQAAVLKKIEALVEKEELFTRSTPVPTAEFTASEPE